MKKELITLEYPLENASEGFLWKMIGDPHGLALWFSDEITVKNNEFTFGWNDSQQTAYLQEIKNGKFIQFQWEEDKDTDFHFKIEIETQDMSGHIGLLVTDYALEEDKQDTIRMWNKQIDDLKRKCGI